MSGLDQTIGAEALPRPTESRALGVGFLVHDFPIISETFVINQARGLLSHGHDLTILAPYGRGPGGDAPMHEAVAEFSLIDRTAYAPLGGIPLRAMEKAPRSVQGYAARAAALVNEAVLFSRRSFDILHCQFASLGLLALKHRDLGTVQWKRLVIHVRGYDISAFVKERGADVYDELWHRADLFMANCEHFRRKAIELGCLPEKIIVVGSSLDLGAFPLKVWQTAERNDLRLVTVGRLTEKKGLTDVLNALHQATASGFDASLTIIGDGPLRGELEDQARRLGIDDRVIFTGALPHQEIARHLRASDCLVAASVSAANGDQDAPVNSLKEAMATGLPVIATRHGGIPELVIDGENGLLVGERAPDQLADAMVRMNALRPSWESMGKKGRERTIAMFEHGRITERIIGTYQDILRQGADT